MITLADIKGGLYRRLVQAPAQSRVWRELDNRIPDFLPHVEQMKAVGALGARSQPWPAIDLVRTIDLINPRSYLEYGSGCSTGVFASFAKSDESIRVESVEEDPDWASFTRDSLAAAGLLGRNVTVSVAPRQESAEGVSYAFDVQGEPDLVLVDGPRVRRINGVQPPCLDILSILAAGKRPKAIVVDARHATVDAINDSMFISDYLFCASDMYRIRSTKRFVSTGNIGFRLYKESVFVRRDLGLAK